MVKLKLRLVGLIIVMVVLSGCDKTAMQDDGDVIDVNENKEITKMDEPNKKDDVTSESVEDMDQIVDFDKGIVLFGGYPLLEREVHAIAKMDYVNIVEASLEWKDFYNDQGDYDFTQLDDVIAIWEEAGKKVDIRVMTANTSIFSAPESVILKTGIRMISDGYFCDFDENLGTFDIFATLSPLEDNPIGKGGVLKGSNVGQEDVVLVSTSSKQPNSPNEKHLVQFDYLALEDSQYFVRFLDQEGRVVKEKFVSVQQGDAGLEQFHELNESSGSVKVEIGLSGSGALCIDNLHITQTTNTRYKKVGYPHYFSDAFKNVYEDFVKELGQRYNNNPSVMSVSVSGLGRWEEAILGATENFQIDSLVKEQWEELEFTEQNYFEHIEWAMKLHKQYFDQKKIKMQVSPIFHGYENEDIGMRKIADLSVKYDIDLKQNGMSEKYDSWSRESYASYVMNKYRYDPKYDVQLTYETGGQMYNNFIGAMGHPINLLNRTLIDGADYLYLYGVDILEPNVNKYFYYADAQFGDPFFTKFYARLGDYSMLNQHTNVMTDYKNIWLGLRQFEGNASKVNYVVKDGKKCVQTLNGLNNQYRVDFALDNRAQYNGMTGTTVSIEYFDEGTDTFTVRFLNQNTGRMDTFGEVVKTNSKEWKTISFYSEAFTNSFKNVREDSVSLMIDDQKDGSEYISRVDIDFVPIKEFALEIQEEKTSTEEHKIIKDTDEFNLSLTGEGISVLELELFSSEIISVRTDVVVELYKNDPEGQRLISKKQMYLFEDHDVLVLPFSPEESGDYTVKVSDVQGRIGIYLDNTGSLAYKTYGFIMEEVTINKSEFEARESFGALEVEGYEDEVLLIKLLPDGSTVKTGNYSPNENQMIYISPQTSGSYKLEGGKVKSIRLLKRKNDVASNRFTSQVKTNITDKLKTLNGWKNLDGQIIELNSLGKMNINLTSSSAEILREDLEFKAQGTDMFSFSLVNKTSSGLLKVFWADQDEPFSDEQSCFIPIVSHDGIERDYTYPIGREFNYTGDISKMKVILIDGIINVGEVELSSMSINQEPIFAEWSFDQQADIFLGKGRTTGLVKNGLYQLSGENINFGTYDAIAPTFNRMAGEERLFIRLENLSDANKMSIGWVSKNVSDIGKYTSLGTQSIEIEANQEGYMDYEIDLTSNEDWKDSIVQLRISFNNETTGTIYIDEIKIAKE